MSIKTRASVLAIRKESVEGVPNLANSNTDFIALQDGFSFSPQTDVIENAELRNSIAQAKTRPGIERAAGSHSHYIRHSGTEGTAPNWGILLESLLGGLHVVATEPETTSGSTVTTLELDTGDGALVRRGGALLIKDPVNGRAVRNIRSISSDSVILAFKLASAPATGVKLGKNVGYYPVNNGHASLTYDLFRGNGGDREVVSGCKIESASISVESGQYINGSFNVRGSKFHFNPIKIEANSKFLDFNDGNVRAVSVPEKVYRDPHELAETLEKALNDSASTDNFTVKYHDYGTNKGKFTITSDGSSLSLPWNTGANAANSIGTKLGFLVAANDTGSLSYTSDNAQNWATSLTPAYDSQDPYKAVACELFIGDQDNDFNICARNLSFDIGNEISEKPCISSETGIDGVEIQRRTVSVNVTATLDPQSAREFKYYRKNDTIQLALTFGEKSGGWVEGRTCNVYCPTASVSSFEIQDDNGDAVLVMTLDCFADENGNPEFYFNCL